MCVEKSMCQLMFARRLTSQRRYSMALIKAWNTRRKLVPTTMNTVSQSITSQDMVELIFISHNLYHPNVQLHKYISVLHRRNLKPLRLRRHERNGMLHGKIESLASACMENN